MNIFKRNKYIKRIYPALHTLDGYCDYCDLDLLDPTDEVITTAQPRKVRGQDRYRFYLKMNPNKTVPGDLHRTISEFQKVLDEALERVGAVGFTVNRADMSFNSDDEADYDLYKKLNRLILCCLADSYGLVNCYQTYDLWSYRSLSLAVKGDRIEAENYNKELEDPTVKTKARLELRSKRMNTDLQTEFLQNWSARLDAAVDRFDAVQERYNTELAKIWKLDQEKPPKQRDFVTVTAFLMQFKDCLFTRKQLRDLLEQMGVNNPDGAAKRFKDRHTVEFFSKTDLKIVTRALKQAMQTYFEQ